MSERPIPLHDWEVRAILDGRKTQTRRAIPDRWWRCLDPEDEVDRARAVTMCPYGVPGDHLWVRETWATPAVSDKVRSGYVTENILVYFRADSPANHGKWRPSIHMPRWASRITLEITDVRVQRVQDIRGPDCVAEGVVIHKGLHVGTVTGEWRAAFRTLWDSINAKKGYGWDANPWVWVLTFRRIDDE